MRRLLMLLPVPLLLLLPLISGCARKPAATQDDGLFVRGRARVVAVNPALATVTLDIDGKQVQAYWELEQVTAQGGAVVRQGSFRPPIADYREPIVSQQFFPAQEGDVVMFVAMKTGNSLFLRGVQVVKP